MYFYAIDLCASMCCTFFCNCKVHKSLKALCKFPVVIIFVHAPPPPQKKRKKEEELWFVQKALDTKVLNIYLTAINVNYEKSLAKDVVESKQFFFMWCFS